jgi:hypothetical protein
MYGIKLYYEEAADAALLRLNRFWIITPHYRK